MARPHRSHQRWDADDADDLLEMYVRRYTWQQIAELLGRSELSVMSKLGALKAEIEYEFRQPKAVGRREGPKGRNGDGSSLPEQVFDLDPDRSYVRWSRAEDELLRQFAGNGSSAAAIALSVQRSVTAIEARLRRLGLPAGHGAK